MNERDRALRPLEEAEPSIERLATYESPAALQEALRATWHAVELSLRQLLRSDTTAPDELRLRAMSHSEMSFDTVISELRRRDLVSLATAGQIHQMSQAVQRAEGGVVRAADADAALAAVDALRTELSAASAPATAAARPHAETRVPIEEWEHDAGESAVQPEATSSSWLRQPAGRRVAAVVVSVVLLLGLIVVMVRLFGGPGDLEQGITAFREGRSGIAEQHFRAELRRDAGSITARLYLARILREQSRFEEAANLLRDAARLAPRDAAVRRELGYLFLALERPQQAAAQFQQSVELEPDEPLGWVWLVQALRRAGDPSAEVWLGRAPPTAQAILRTGRAP